MSSQRPARPPVLDGYTHERLIGQGGFADVFLYHEHKLDRPVAVKVLLDTALDGVGLAQFDAETKVMAQLSNHPAIVPIYKAATTGDGRPYLVMPYYSRPNLGRRFREERIEVPEALEIGIRMAGALETAHRAGVLHRDIKPHNILTNDAGEPMLTDFGIAVIAGENDDTTGGFSVPWSPPEIFWDEPPEDPRSDVWSLAATVYSLLSGRSPFERKGEANDAHTLISRIERQRLSRLTRLDVPDNLNDALERAMAKSIDDRYVSAHSFAVALQEVQVGLRITPTRIPLLEAFASEAARPRGDEARTEIRPITVINPEPVVSSTVIQRADTSPAQPQPQPEVETRIPGRRSSAVIDRPVESSPISPSPAELAGTWSPSTGLDDTRAKIDEVLSPPSSDRSQGHIEQTRPRLVWIIAAAAAAVVAGVVVISLRHGDSAGQRPDTSLREPSASAAVDPRLNVPGVTIVAGTVSASHAPGPRVARFRWRNPDRQPGDSYLWQRWENGSPVPPMHTTESSVITFGVGKRESGCIRIYLHRSSGGTTPVESSGPFCPQGSG